MRGLKHVGCGVDQGETVACALSNKGSDGPRQQSGAGECGSRRKVGKAVGVRV